MLMLYNIQKGKGADTMRKLIDELVLRIVSALICL